MPTDRPDPGDFLEQAQRMLRELFGNPREGDQRWSEATGPRRGSEAGDRLSAEERRENLTFSLATRAVEALEDLALDVAAIRQRLERTGSQTQDRRPDGHDAPGK
ncbi:MAG: hypothetical protein JWQ45_2752 [Blastococcus sp.]|jgi:hypothetical protein|nr:hypothetical protein [Blastococcus sp.]